jgi:signal transduction histidine kinase/CheY-like chemotaxis protein
MFNSRITLTYKDKFIEGKYKEARYESLRQYNITLSIILTVLSIIITGLMIKEFPLLKQTLPNFAASIYCFTSAALTIIITILSIYTKNNRCQEWLAYLNYLMVLFVFTNYKFYSNFVLKADILIYVLIFFTEIMFRLAWFIFGCIDFLPGAYLQLITIVLNFSLYGIIVPLHLFFRFSIHNCILIFTSILSYLYIKEHKRCFYYNFSLKLKNGWYKSIIDNMNSGFISIKDKCIKYYNKPLLNFLKNAYCSTSKTDLDSQDSNLSELSRDININELFSNIYSDNILVNSFEQLTDILKENFNETEEERFYFIGTKDVELTSSSYINLEIFGRCNSTNHNQIDSYEFIFNDITRTKHKAQENAELKYKTLFLSKIAHEFKNPLLCICELVEQLFENITHGIYTDITIHDILLQIKSLSNYLIILIKDMDFFSQKSSERIEKRVEVDKINLSDVLNFCQDVVKALIKKSHKEPHVNFQLVKDQYLPTHISTDEIKLKQVLINLLSNAAKYTATGSIDLRVSIENQRLKFQVDDTGKGISDSLKDKLFTPFSNEFDKLNKVSSGLGLSIVKELLEMLGSKIEFTSIVSKGSSFWFTMQLEEYDKRSFVSDETVVGIHYSELLIANRISFTQTSLPKNYVIVVDDEMVIRQSTIRLLYSVFKELNYNTSIIEASDGMECLYHYYSHVKEGKNVAFILSDETMMYMDGSSSAAIMKKVVKGRGLQCVPFYILTAYENLSYDFESVERVFTKPLRKQNIEQIINNIR